MNPQTTKLYHAPGVSGHVIKQIQTVSFKVFILSPPKCNFFVVAFTFEEELQLMFIPMKINLELQDFSEVTARGINQLVQNIIPTNCFFAKK